MIPDKTRSLVLARAHGCCEYCGWRPVELHHLRYEIDGHHGPDPIDGQETPDDLEALCRECHLARHLDPNGDFWRNPEEMYHCWAGYYDDLAKD